MRFFLNKMVSLSDTHWGNFNKFSKFAKLVKMARVQRVNQDSTGHETCICFWQVLAVPLPSLLSLFYTIK
jgi:hypothetical protein